MNISVSTDPISRFWQKVNKTPTCWLWTGARMVQGYGELKWNRKTRYAHIIAYSLMVGPTPPGLTLDHLCRVRHCVNPEHLEPVTHRENCLRGESPTAINARKTHCKEGHLLVFDGLHRRRCKICKAATDRARRIRLADAIKTPRPLSRRLPR